MNGNARKAAKEEECANSCTETGGRVTCDIASVQIATQEKLATTHREQPKKQSEPEPCYYNELDGGYITMMALS